MIMKSGFAVSNPRNLGEIEKEGLEVYDRLTEFIVQLKALTEVDMPRGIVFHDLESATELFSSIPLPAYTSRDLIHMDPRVSTWKTIYLTSIEVVDSPIAKEYYEKLNQDDVMLIAAHELVHHSEFFHSEFDSIDEEAMWFEEGMCELIPRLLLMESGKRSILKKAEDELITAYSNLFGSYSLRDFGKAGGHYAPDASYASLFYDYWRSTKTVEKLLEGYFAGNLHELINHYVKWTLIQDQSLSTYFIDTLNIPQSEVQEMWLI
jgi:hypothetical protein